MSEPQIVTEELDDFKLKVSYLADRSVVQQKNTEALEQLRHMKIPGFRPGKATDLALKFKFKDRIKQWVQAEMLSEANDDIVFQTKIVPLGKPSIQSVNLDGSNFKLEAVYNKKPEFTLSEYKGLEVPEPHLKQTVDERVEQYIQTLREKHSDVRPYGDNDFVQGGDTVTLDYSIPNEAEEGRLYEVGSNLFEEFDQNLLGMTAGETRTFDVLVNGSRETCIVTVHMGLKKVLCPLDVTLAQRCGVNSLEEVTASVKTIAENQAKAERNAAIADQIRSQLLEKNQFEVPQWLLLQEANLIASHQGLVYAQLDKDTQEAVLKQASDKVRFTLIVDEIKDAEPDVELNDMEALEGIKHDLAQRGVKDIQGVLKKTQQDGLLGNLVAQMKHDYVIQWLIDNAKIVS